MNIKTTSIIIGLLVAVLGVYGLVAGEGLIADTMNISLMLDIVRVALGAYLVFAGITSVNASRTALAIFGIAYLGMFLVGLVSPNLYGMAPEGLGWMDQALHLGGGLLGLALPFLTQPARRGRVAY